MSPRGRWDEPGKGKRGPAGESAYEIAVRLDGFQGTEQQWLESQRGPPGLPGTDATGGGGGGSGTVTSVAASGSTGLSVGGSPIVTAGTLTFTLSANLQAWNGVTTTSKAETTRAINTTAPLAGGGDLSANRTLSITAATTTDAGSMSAADKTKLDSVATGATANVGTVTSVAVTGTTGLVVGGSPITGAGTVTLTLDTGLQALASYNTSAFLVQTATNVFAGRTLTGTSGRLTITNGTGVAGNPVFDIDPAWVGQATITTLGTITTGVWSGTAIAANKGGTGLTAFTAGNYLNAATTSTLQERTPAQVRSDIGAAVAGPATASGLTTSTETLLGRDTAGTGAIEEISIGSGLALTAGVLSVTAGGTGTVTSVDLAASTGLTPSGGPITGAGSLTYTLSANLQAWHGLATSAKQDADADLTAVAALAANGLATRTATNTWNVRTITGVANRTTITNGGGVSGNPTIDIHASYVGQATITTVGTIGTGTWAATAIAANRGGTGQTVYAVGDILYASTTTALSKLADVATGNALISGGVGVAPAWGKIALTTHVSGVLPIANGGGLSGTYTPTNTGVANIASMAGANVCQYMRVGNTVAVSGIIALTPTAAGALTQCRMSLPIASAISGIEQCCGTAVFGAGFTPARIYGDAASDQAMFEFQSAGTSFTTATFSFIYQVI